MLQLAIKIGIDFICASGLATAVVPELPLDYLILWAFGQEYLEFEDKWYSLDKIGDETRAIHGGSVALLNGVNQGVTIPASSTINDIFAGGGEAVFYIHPDATVTANNRLYEKTDYSAGSYFLLNVSGGLLGLYFSAYFTGSNPAWRNTADIISSTKISKVSVSYNSDTLDPPIVTVDDVVIAMTQLTAPIGTYKSDAAFDMTLFNRPPGDRPYKGIVSEVILKNQGVEVAGYHLEEEAGSDYYDYTGNGNHATGLNYLAGMRVKDANVTSYADTEGYSNALLLNGTSEYIRIEPSPSIVVGTSDFSFKFKVKDMSVISAGRLLSNYGDGTTGGDGSNYVIFVAKSAGKELALDWKKDGVFVAQSGDFSGYTSNNETIELKRSGTTVSVLVDNVVKYSKTINIGDSFPDVSYPFTIGVQLGGTPGSFVGGLFSRFSMGISGDTKVEYNFKDGKVIDESGNGNDGSVVNDGLFPLLPAVGETSDALGNTLQHQGRAKYNPQIVSSSNLTFNGTTQLLRFDDLSGVTIVSSIGTAIPLVSSDDITLSAGTLEHLVLSNGSIYTFASGAGDTVYDTVNGNHATIINYLEDMWTFSDGRPDNILDGFSLYTHTTLGDLRVPYSSAGAPITIIPPVGYTKVSDNQSDYWHNNSESDFNLPATKEVIDADLDGWGFTAGVPNDLSYADIVDEVQTGDNIFADVSVENEKKDLVIYSETQTGTTLDTIKQYLNQQVTYNASPVTFGGEPVFYTRGE